MTHVDHLLISVRELESAMERWASAGLTATAGGTHPGGTFNAMVRGPQRAYIELISAAEDSTSEAAARVLSVAGPLSWALGVEDLDQVRDALQRHGQEFGQVQDGSRTTPTGDILRWQLCDIGPYALHEFLPFLIEWETEMEPGGQEGPEITSIHLEVPEPPHLSKLLEVCGLRRLPHARGSDITLTDGDVEVVLRPGQGGITSATIALLAGPTGEVSLDGLRVQRTSRA